ncbi:MAG: TonB-dependent receptor [Bacteroidales bacterium]|nr:TonB-dependent receptor [Bacteroidales bacterium]
MKLCLLTALLATLHLSLYPGEFTQNFRGRVLDAYTELPLPGATVIILGSDPLKGASTDTEGEFRFEHMPVGRLDIQVSMMGYKSSVLQNLLISSGRELVITVRLEEQVYMLSDVEVRPEIRKDQAINEMAMVSARSFTIDETERYAGSLGDPSRMAANFAGVSSASDQRNDIIIRGNSPLSLLWRLEGVEIPNPNHFGSIGSTGGPVSMINNNHLDNSDFYTAAFPAEFGNALAGAFDLRMRNGNNERHEFMGQVGFNGLELGAEGPFSAKRRASYLVNVRYSTLEVLHAAGMSFGTGAAIPKYKDISFKINLPLDRGRLTVFGLGGDNEIAMLDSREDDAQYGFAGTDLYYGNRMGVTGISHVHYISNDVRFVNTLAVSGIRGMADIFELSDSLDQPNILEDLGEITYTFSTRYSQRFNARNFLNTGIILNHYDLRYVGQEYQHSTGDYLYYINTTGSMNMARWFAEWNHRFSDELSISTGVHAAYLFLNDTYAVEPRFGLRWSFAPKQSLSLGAGLHSQMQMKGVYFSQGHTGDNGTYTQNTNEHLGFSRSLHLVGGYDRLLGEGHRLKTEIYYQKLFNIPVSWCRPEFSLISQGGSFNYWFFADMENSGIGENKGVEITLEKFLHKGFYYLVTASVFDAGYRGYDGIWRNSAFNNNFIFNALTGYEWKIGQRSLLSADIKMVYAGGNRYLEIDVERSIAENSARYKWDEAYEKKHPDYFRLNGRVTFRLNGRNINQEWALDLQNMTNRQNVFTENWNNSKQEVTTSYQMGFMPMMTYRIYF